MDPGGLGNMASFCRRVFALEVVDHFGHCDLNTLWLATNAGLSSLIRTHFNTFVFVDVLNESFVHQ